MHIKRRLKRKKQAMRKLAKHFKQNLHRNEVSKKETKKDKFRRSQIQKPIMYEVGQKYHLLVRHFGFASDLKTATHGQRDRHHKNGGNER